MNTLETILWHAIATAGILFVLAWPAAYVAACIHLART